MIVFWFLLIVILFQRGLELVFAKKNEQWMKQRGGKEFGANHYKWIVLLHLSFFLCLTIEVFYKGGELIPLWPIFLSLFITAQIVRAWVLTSLGKYWNTKIIVLPGEKRVKKGPYQWVSHPNYWVVAIELFTLPLIFQAYVTALLFTIANAGFLLFVRIPKEEEALKWLVDAEQ
ncbi:isoprenylcysteine carboxyl methyltransferase family protein [Evansella halocellulosilytica]|uniref:isoprenylcysteine carboxyl methyltransferase family protein n=1 Tax=Evansella halocellulosilytica TaxID=2011013 RepID=UPI000BB8844B|nr:isoprenylcysteine carboxylmethyltransferase family protein [Evansella halocellulosilytica]